MDHLSFDERRVKKARCPRCRRDYEFVTGLVLKKGTAYAIYHAACHGHPGHEVWADVILGTWTGDGPFHDHVTFGCHVHGDGAGAVDAPVAIDPGPMTGELLSREQALNHPRIQELWAIVDFMVVEDPSIAAYLARH